MHSLTINSKSGKYNANFYNTIDKTLLQIKDYLLIVDSNVYNLHPEYFQDNTIIFECNENNKSLEGAILILNELVKRKIKSNGKVAVIGGGILQDVAGFACSIYCRGIEYILVPTTLLSQCDSCIGGKTSINFESVKNILGTFYPPKEILICPEFLNTLTIADYLSGVGEIIKFNALKNTLDSFEELYSKKDNYTLIYDSLKYKANIIEIDEFDKAERKFLNFGHTFGHALESTSNYVIPHGTGVLFGILIANNISTHLGYLNLNKNLEMQQLIYKFIEHQDINKTWFNFDNLLEVIKLDKKNTGSINMVLLTDNEPIITKIDNLEILKQTINEVIGLCNTIS
jgi:3-dehydroquinate synthase